MKEALLKGGMDSIGDIFNFGWEHKKKTVQGISNPLLEDIYNMALHASATGGKVSGAGGGGFMFFFCPSTVQYNVEKALLQQFAGQVKRCEFTIEGLKTRAVYPILSVRVFSLSKIYSITLSFCILSNRYPIR